jgi:hypothetical protein
MGRNGKLTRRWPGLGLVRRLFGNAAGNTCVEVAVSLPVLILLTLAGVDLVRLLLIDQKVERTAATLADLVSQSEGLTEAEIVALFNSTAFVMEPFDIQTGGRLILSSVSVTDDDEPTIQWQRFYGTGTGDKFGSKIGAENEEAALPVDDILTDGESLIAAEAFFPYQPLFMDTWLGTEPIYRTAFFRPRFATLTTVAD